MKKIFMGALIAVLLLVYCTTAYSTSLLIDNGLQWIIANQNSTGSWGNTDNSLNPLTTEYFASTAVIETLRDLDQSNTLSYQSGIQWLLTQTDDNTAYLAYRISILQNAGIDVTTDLNALLSYKNSDNGWGGYLKYTSSNYHTALALQALKKTNYSDPTVINNAISYLLSNQNSDGGFGFYQGDDSNIYITALVSSTLQQVPQTTSIATAVNKAKAYFIANQNSDGGFGSPESTVYETSLAYIALVGVTTDNTLLGNAVNYLTSAQLSDGSWNEDPYSTALALRALYFSQNKPSPPPSLTTGAVTGTVVDASTNQPLSGVSVVLQSNSATSAVTDSSGSFILSNIPAGSQKVTMSLSGYTTYTITVNIAAGATATIGKIPMSTNPNAGIITGTATDASNSQPLADVTITVTGSFSARATTGADGSFAFADAVPGAVTITASKAGYYTIKGSGTISAGGILTFNPVMSTSTPPQTTVTITGKVTDASTGNPIAGATIRIEEANMSVQTGADGTYTITGVNLLDFSIAASATGYDSLNYSFSTTTYGTFTVDYSLNPTSSSDVRITSLTTDKLGYPSDSRINVAATVENKGNAAVTVQIIGQVEDSQSTVLDILPLSSPPPYSTLNAMVIDINPLSSISAQLAGNTYQFAPGNYTFVVKIIDPVKNAVVAEGAASFQIVPTRKAEIIRIASAPQFTHVGGTETISLSMLFADLSNIPVQYSINYSVKTPSGAIINNGTVPLALTPDPVAHTVDLGIFTYTFTQSGSYPVDVSITGDGESLATGKGTISVAPTIRVEPTKTLTPNTVLPDGDKQITIKIHLQGQE